MALTGLISEQRRQVEEEQLLLFIPCFSILFKLVINSLLILLFKSSKYQKELMDKRNGPTSIEKKRYHNLTLSTNSHTCFCPLLK